MQELERIKGMDSVADGLMKSDRNFTRLKLEVENIDVTSQVNDAVGGHNTSEIAHPQIQQELADVIQQSNENATEITAHKAESANKAHGGFKGALVYRSSATSVPDGVSTLIPWNGVDYDTSVIHSVEQNTRLTVPDGVTRVKLSFNIIWGLSSVGARLVRVRKNGNVFRGGTYLADETNTMTSAGDTEKLFRQFASTPALICAPGDFFELEVFQFSGGALDVSGGSTGIASYFTLEVIE